jgi:sulfoxide reductase heme-binding subunit YedZ
MKNLLHSLRFTKFQIFVHIAALTPLAWLILDYFTDNLTFNPIQAVTLRTGRYAIILLMLSLACTPINTIFGFRQAIKVRRPLGLYAFMYASIHFMIFLGVDYGFNLGLIFEEIITKRYIIAGFTAGLILLPLAITSTKGWMKRLGIRWKQLHKFVYIAGLLAVTHYIWVVKSDYRLPLAVGAVLFLLLIARRPSVRKYLANLNISRRLKGLFSNRVKQAQKNIHREENHSQRNSYSAKKIET